MVFPFKSTADYWQAGFYFDECSTGYPVRMSSRFSGPERDSRGNLFLVSCQLFVGRIGLEKRPTPSIAPQFVVGETVFCILDLHEPHFYVLSLVRITGRQFGMTRPKYFLN